MSPSLLDVDARPAALPRPIAYGLALAMTAAATVAGLLLERAAPVSSLSLLYVLPVAIAALSLGWGPAVVAVVAGVLAYNFFLLEPRYTLRVADPANVVALVLLLVIAMLLSAAAAQSRGRATRAWRAAEQAAALNALARGLVGARDVQAVASLCAEALSRLFGAPAVIWLEGEDGLMLAAVAGGAAPAAPDEEAAGWSLASRSPTRGREYPVADAVFDCWPVVSAARRRACIGLRISGGDDDRPAAPERLVEIVGGYLAVALDREAYAAQAVSAEVALAGDRVRSDLLAAVSHDLKTPLATVLLSLQSLRRFSGRHDAAAREDLLRIAEEEATRLDRMVGDLLDVNRLEAGAPVVRPEPVAAADLVARAIQRVEPALAGRDLRCALEAAHSLLMVDPGLFEAALGNVLENAAKYAPVGPIEVSAGEAPGEGWIEVRDEGDGFGGVAERMFERFGRGVAGDGRPPGMGLGLTLARGFLEAQGGRAEAGDRRDRRGAWVRLTAPLAAAG
jgi:two-component system sensor histidine kinase KdpD